MNSQMQKNSKIYVAGHRGLVGSAIVRELKKQGFQNLVLRTHAELDLTDAVATQKFFETEKPEYVFLAAAKVGGILANDTQGADFIYQNLMIQNHVIHQSYKNSVKKLLFLGSSCIYPKMAKQPLKEEYLLTGPLESTNEAYAIAKIAGIKMCQHYRKQYGCHFISAMPTNLYGPGDNYDLKNSHVLPALIRKFHEARVQNRPFVEVWGSGKPLREFLYSDDLGSALVFLMQREDAPDLVNVGAGRAGELSIFKLANLIKKIVGYTGELKFDRSKPDGTPRKAMDISKLTHMGWQPQTALEEGIRLAYEDFKANSH